MRIVSGYLKSRTIKEQIPNFIRPTTDKVREAIFNIIENHISIEDTVVADICAGTGMLGFESISRGCQHCIFVDKNVKSIFFIKSLADSFGISKDKYSLQKSDALKFLNTLSINYPDVKFDLIFTDPPYKANFINQMVRILNKEKLLKHDGIFVAEHDDTEIILIPKNWEKFADKTYGITKVEIFKNKNLDF